MATMLPLADLRDLANVIGGGAAPSPRTSPRTSPRESRLAPPVQQSIHSTMARQPDGPTRAVRARSPACLCLRVPARACACLRVPARACACLRVPARACAKPARRPRPRGRVA
jgi:hypothetical protein